MTVGEEQREIALSALDVNATLALNRQRGIDLKIPQNRNEVYCFVLRRASASGTAQQMGLRPLAPGFDTARPAPVSL